MSERFGHTDQEYLGDGVYASFDGWQVWLAANHHTNIVIALEPVVFDELVAYRDRLIAKLRRRATYHPKDKG